MSTVLRQPKRTLADYEQIGRAHALGHATIYHRVPEIPREPSAFIECLRAIHRKIFEEGEPAIAGRLRTGAVEFGGDASHRLEGCDPTRIIERLTWLVGQLPAPNELQRMDAEQFAEHCSLFLERFFRIHPFTDGNGRVGRLVLESLAVHETRFVFSPFDASSRGRRRYVKALQFAHKFSSESVHVEGRSHRDPMRYLRKFIRAHLIEIDLEDDVTFDDGST